MFNQDTIKIISTRHSTNSTKRLLLQRTRKLICDSALHVWCVGKIRRTPKHPISISPDNRGLEQTKNRGQLLDLSCSFSPKTNCQTHSSFLWLYIVGKKIVFNSNQPTLHEKFRLCCRLETAFLFLQTQILNNAKEIETDSPSGHCVV